MITIYFDKNKSNKMRLSFKYIEKEFNLNRNNDECIETTFQKLISNYEKKSKNKNKIQISIIDQNNNLISLDTKNGEAWKEENIFKFNNKEFKIKVNLPFVKKIEISKILLVGMRATVQTIFDSNTTEAIKLNSKYFWYFSSKEEETKWNLIHFNNNGTNISKSCILTEDCLDSFIKVMCIPNDGQRDGIPIEVISLNKVQNKINNLDNLPMTERHLITNSFLGPESIRVMSYNILHKSGTSQYSEDYLFCSKEYSDFNYRRVLLLHEIKSILKYFIFFSKYFKIY
jgi:hypothetical protein